MSSSSSTEFILEFKERPYGFRLVGDDCNKNAIVKSILNDKLSSKLNVGSWIIQINNICVESWEFNKIINILRNEKLPIIIKFKCLLIINGIEKELYNINKFNNKYLNIIITDTGKEPSQQRSGKHLRTDSWFNTCVILDHRLICVETVVNISKLL